MVSLVERFHCIYIYTGIYICNTTSKEDALGPHDVSIIIEVSLFRRLVGTVIYYIGTLRKCPYYGGVLITEVITLLCMI